jgi:UDP:flavonoid glycosyltransferase YjiC (YdhE family)
MHWKSFEPQLSTQGLSFVAGSANEAMYYGVPMIAIPQAGDQPWVAQRIVQVGAGKELARGKLSVKRLRQSVEEILANPSYAQASARMGETLRQAGGYQRAVDEIQEFKHAHKIIK